MENKEIARRINQILDDIPGRISIQAQLVALRDELDPPLKVIDLSPLVGSNVICEFADEGGPGGTLNFLVGIHKDGTFLSKGGGTWDMCRPLYNHPNVYFYEADVLPGANIPEGFMVEWLYPDGMHHKSASSYETNKSYLAYRITGVSKGWRLPFEGGAE